MDERDQISAFGRELDLLVIRFMEEFDLPYEAYVGTLQMKAVELTNAALYDMEDDEEFG